MTRPTTHIINAYINGSSFEGFKSMYTKNMFLYNFILASSWILKQNSAKLKSLEPCL